MKKYLFLIISFGSFFLLTSIIPKLALTAPVETSAKVLTQLRVAQLRQIAQAITVRVYVGETSSSGTLIKRQGQVYTVLTNAHVVDRGNSYRIQTPDGKIHQATLRISGNSPDTDLAVLEFTAPDSYSVASLDLAPQISPQQPVYAAGFPFNQSDLVFDSGQISLISTRPIRGGYQIGFTNQTKQGMSGGALLDSNGRVIGILGLSKFPVLNTAYTYQDGTKPEPRIIQQMRQASFAVPIRRLEMIQPRKSLAKNQTKNTNSTYQTPYTDIVGKVDTIAQQITVRIDNLKDNSKDNSNGSGVIIAREGNTYYVLTAKHVLCLPEDNANCILNGENKIVTPDGKTYAIDPQTVKIPGEWLDLAVVSFESDETYQIATLGDYQLKEQWIFTSGFPATEDSSEPQRILTGGTVFEKEYTDFYAKDSYSLSYGRELLYTNISYKGMSGGVVLDSIGQVVGINIGVEGEIAASTNSKTFQTLNLGYSLGIPTTNFIGLVEKSAINSESIEVSKNVASDINENEIKIIGNQLLIVQELNKNADYVDWINHGNQLWRYGIREEAIKAYSKAIPLKSNSHEAYYGIGLAYYDLGQYNQAIIYLKKATVLEPKIAYYWRWLGESYESLEEYVEALATYNEAIVNNEDPSLVLYFKKGSILSELKQYLQAINFYSKALVVGFHPGAYNDRGVAYHNLEQYNKAITDYTQAIFLNPNKAIFYNNRGVTYDSLGQYDKAITDYTQAISLNSEYTNAYHNRGNTYRNLGQYDKAIADYAQAISLDSDSIKAYNSRGHTHNDLEQYKKAIADYTQAISLDSDNIEAYNSRGNTYRNLGQYDKAIADYTQAISLNFEYAEIFYNNRGITYSILEQYDKAIADYTQAIFLNSEYAAPYYNRGVTYDDLGEYKKALADYDKAISLNPEDADAYDNRADTYLNLGEYDKAIADYDRAISLNPEDADAYYNRGFTYLNLGEYDKAIADYDRAISLNPEYTDAYYNRGIAYQALQQDKEAISDYQQALTINPNYYLASNNLGLIAYEKNQITQAIAYWQQTLKIAPDTEETNLALAIAEYQQGKTEKAVEIAAKVLSANKQWRDLNFLREQLWGDKLIEDFQSLLRDQKLQKLAN